MATLLAIDTATSNCSVALLHKGTNYVCERNEPNIHGSVLTLFVQDVLKQANCELKHVDAFVVGMGPGSYTGLRIGISTAKGFCFALDKPLIAINTLKGMANGYAKLANLEENTLICPMLDARRMEVYTAFYDPQLNEIYPTAADIIDENSYIHYLETNKMHFIGDGVQKCSAIFGSKPNTVLDFNHLASAKYLLDLGLEKYNNQEFEDVAYFEPFYLKDFLITTPKNKSTT